jgi:shikimate dehydrogenase
MTKTYAVIGDPIDHSLSPAIHNAAFAFLGMDCTYIAYRIPRGELAEGINALKRINIAGFNVTIPHKIEVMKLLDDTDEVCRTIGATNTVNNENGKLKGYNTDMDGFLEPIKQRNQSCKDANVLLIGAGGAARAIVAAVAKEKAHKITIANRTREKAEELVKFANTLGLGSEYTDLTNAGEIAGNFNFIVNATSVGMKNNISPISTRKINKNCTVYDIVYMPVDTELLEQSKKQGATIIYGWEMLLAQAMRSFEIWTKRKAPYEAMKLTLLGRF